jgi:hypothetical protein
MVATARLKRSDPPDPAVERIGHEHGAVAIDGQPGREVELGGGGRPAVAGEAG